MMRMCRHKKELIYRYKKSQLEQDLQTAYDQESTLPHSDDDGDGDESETLSLIYSSNRFKVTLACS